MAYIEPCERKEKCQNVTAANWKKKKKKEISLLDKMPCWRNLLLPSSAKNARFY
jgi:hypothetical protein